MNDNLNAWALMDKVVSAFLYGGDYEESLRTTKFHVEALIRSRDLPANAHILATNLINVINRGRGYTRDHDEHLAIGEAIRKLHLVAVRREFCDNPELDIQDSVMVGRD